MNETLKQISKVVVENPKMTVWSLALSALTLTSLIKDPNVFRNYFAGEITSPAMSASTSGYNDNRIAKIIMSEVKRKYSSLAPKISIRPQARPVFAPQTSIRPKRRPHDFEAEIIADQVRQTSARRLHGQKFSQPIEAIIKMLEREKQILRDKKN